VSRTKSEHFSLGWNRGEPRPLDGRSSSARPIAPDQDQLAATCDWSTVIRRTTCTHGPRQRPTRQAAYIMAYSGETVTYASSKGRSNQAAHLFRELGLNTGDSVAFFVDNSPRYYELIWPPRSGLRTPASPPSSPPRVEVHRGRLAGEGVHRPRRGPRTALAVARLSAGVALYMWALRCGRQEASDAARPCRQLRSPTIRRPSHARFSGPTVRPKASIGSPRRASSYTAIDSHPLATSGWRSRLDARQRSSVPLALFTRPLGCRPRSQAMGARV